MSDGLHQNCRFYGDKIDTYSAFSQAEDASGEIAEFLKPIIKGKRVLDFGCGTGKYAQILGSDCAQYIGFDRAIRALKTARQNGGAAIFTSNKSRIARIKQSGFEVVLASWVFGTIASRVAAEREIKWCQSLLAKGGRMILIENDIGGEFEEIRGRFPNNQRTCEYNNWLESLGFKCATKILTQFNFSSTRTARLVMGEIWGQQAADLVHSHSIEHRIVVYSL